MNAYEHDYGTIIHAFAAGMIATCNALLKEPQGGITGFQHSAIGWEVARKMFDLDGPAKLVKFDNMLYPQYDGMFDKTITPSTFKWLQEKAQENLLNKTSASPKVIQHWQAIASGHVPFGYTIKDR